MNTINKILVTRTDLFVGQIIFYGIISLIKMTNTYVSLIVAEMLRQLISFPELLRKIVIRDE